MIASKEYQLSLRGFPVLADLQYYQLFFPLSQDDKDLRLDNPLAFQFYTHAIPPLSNNVKLESAT